MRLNEKDRRRHNRLLRVYGITLDQYNQLLKSQGGGCGICGKSPEDEGKALAVDHDHKTGEVRGILCSYCNHRRIGRHNDWTIVQKMADYLKTGTGWFVPKRKKTVKRKPKRK